MRGAQRELDDLLLRAADPEAGMHRRIGLGPDLLGLTVEELAGVFLGLLVEGLDVLGQIRVLVWQVRGRTGVDDVQLRSRGRGELGGDARGDGAVRGG